ncbi:MAG: PilC/PilY family type IV pilus protein [Pseudomonadales bacterium]|nr:PilC/PilY family type IV pilus protein [Pseudomonadales bacterium]
MNTVTTDKKNTIQNRRAALVLTSLVIASSPHLQAESNADFDAYPPTISNLGASDLPNVLVVLDNSNSMDEAASGAAVGSDDPGSKSEIARGAVQNLITNFAGQMRMGLMAYQQTGVSGRQLHNSPYDASFDPANYNPASTDPRDSLTKKYRTPNTSSPGDYVYYNVALPFYSGGNAGTQFCYSNTADFDNGTETTAGPWDSYRCLDSMTGTTDPNPVAIWGNSGLEAAAGFGGSVSTYTFSPTDSDYAQNILDFGAFMTWYHVGPTWFSNSSPGRGYLHTPIALLDATQTIALNIKLGTSQFILNQPTNPAFPLQNAGLTPLEGTLQTARNYFGGVVLPANEGGPAAAIPANVCSDKDFVVLVTDGLPSTDSSGSAVANPAVAIAAVAAEAANLLAAGVRTYVVGYALPEGVTPGILDSIAIAGGTSVSYMADDPATLSSTLTGIFTDILNRTSAGSAAAVISNNVAGEGALYQALYDPSVTIAGNNVTWGGRLHSLFIDSKGLFREDSFPPNGQLDDYATDAVVEMKYDSVAGVTKVYRYTNSGGNINSVTPTEHTLSELETIWDARDQLSSLTNLTTQRSYNAIITPTSGRHIFTWLDDDGDATAETTDGNGIVDSGETVDFVSASFPTGTASNLYRYLDVPSSDVTNLVNFIRGEEVTGLRSRTIDYDNDSTDEVWRLGDIIHSSPIVVGAPGQHYHTQYNDYSYQAYIDHYKDRRQVLYVGANDGMLHAFNAGFWNDSTTAFDLTNSAGTAVQHPLGSELWAYVPHNLLPHLQWLSDPNYAHVYYVDGEPKAHDVRIFADDATHPGGWGTILVVGMRFGGGENHLDIDNDSVDDTTTRSAYIVLDITDPESAPVLIAEITHPNLGYTLGTPTLVKQRAASLANGWNVPDVNNWYLAFGSGPIGTSALSHARSNQNARYYLYDLGDAALATVRPPGMVSGFPQALTDATSFAGSNTSVDWDFDYSDDAVYFGVTGYAAGADTGALKRMTVNSTASSSTFSTLLASSLPVVAAPYTLTDALGEHWVYAGTGRFLTNSDNAGISQQKFYGVKDSLSSSINTSNLLNTTNIQVFADGSILDPTQPSPHSVVVDSNTISNLDGLRTAIQGKEGWYINLDYDGTNPSARVGNTANSIGKTLLFVDYQPDSNACSPEGTSNLFALDFQTGTAPEHGALGFDSTVTNNSQSLAVASVSLGQGLSSEPVTHTNEDGDVQVITQSSTAAIGATGLTSATPDDGRQSWRVIENWRK